MNGPLTRKLVILPEQVEIVTFRQKAIEAPSIDKVDKQPLLNKCKIQNIQIHNII